MRLGKLFTYAVVFTTVFGATTSWSDTLRLSDSPPPVLRRAIAYE